MRKRLIAILTALVAVSFVVSLSPGHAATSLTVTDDLVDQLDPNINLRSLYRQALPADYLDAMDIQSFTWDSSGGFLTIKLTTVGAWPAEGTLGTAITEAGKSTSGEWRAIFTTDTMKRAYDYDRSCSSNYEEIENPATGDFYHPITYEHTADCSVSREGPYYPEDGFRFWVGLGMTVTSGKISYDWDGYGRYLPVASAFTWVPGLTHDDICAIAANGCTPGVKIFEDAVANAFGPGTTGYKTTGIKIPYGHRDDDTDDHDGNDDETISHTLLQAGDNIQSVMVGTYGTINVKAPPECYYPYRDPVPSPLNDPDYCGLQVNYGVTGILDWAPGNPLRDSDGNAANGHQPYWGGYRPRSIPRSPAYLPTHRAATCSYPDGGFLVRFNQAALQAGGGWIIDGMTIDIPPDGGATLSTPTINNPIPPHTPIPYPTGQEAQKCEFFYVDSGLHFDNTGNGTAAGLVAN